MSEKISIQFEVGSAGQAADAMRRVAESGKIVRVESAQAAVALNHLGREFRITDTTVAKNTRTLEQHAAEMRRVEEARRKLAAAAAVAREGYAREDAALRSLTQAETRHAAALAATARQRQAAAAFATETSRPGVTTNFGPAALLLALNQQAEGVRKNAEEGSKLARSATAARAAMTGLRGTASLMALSTFPQFSAAILVATSAVTGLRSAAIAANIPLATLAKTLAAPAALAGLVVAGGVALQKSFEALLAEMDLEASNQDAAIAARTMGARLRDELRKLREEGRISAEQFQDMHDRLTVPGQTLESIKVLRSELQRMANVSGMSPLAQAMAAAEHARAVTEMTMLGADTIRDPSARRHSIALAIAQERNELQGVLRIQESIRDEIARTHQLTDETAEKNEEWAEAARQVEETQLRIAALQRSVRDMERLEPGQFSTDRNFSFRARMRAFNEMDDQRRGGTFGNSMKTAFEEFIASAGNMQQRASAIFGAVGDGVNALSAGIANAALYTGEWGRAFAQAGVQIVQSLIQIAVRMAAMAVLAAILGPFFGGFGGVFRGLVQARFFQSGGYTGDGPDHQLAGGVHRGEYVVSAPDVRRIGLPTLRSMFERSSPATGNAVSGYRGGGEVTAAPASRVNVAMVNTLQERREWMRSEGVKLVLDGLRRRGNRMST